MKNLIAFALSFFCIGILNAAPVKTFAIQNTPVYFDSERNEKVLSTQTDHKSSLPCTQTSTQTATQTWPGCNGGTVTASATFTCTATGSSCDDAIFAATQCAYINAWSYVSSQEPVCPPE